MKVELFEHCFGSGANVDGVDVAETDKELFDPESQKEARRKIISELTKNMDNIPAYYWTELAEMAVRDNPEFELNEEENYNEVCEQCGNWNSTTVYINTKKEEND